jgi:hypothetical protein
MVSSTEFHSGAEQAVVSLCEDLIRGLKQRRMRF